MEQTADLPRSNVEMIVFQHDDWGEARTYWDWQHMGHGLFRWRCVGVEFDFFCPAEEQDRLLAWLRPYPTSK
jgi:hypothetical protein